MSWSVESKMIDEVRVDFIVLLFVFKNYLRMLFQSLNVTSFCFSLQSDFIVNFPQLIYLYHIIMCVI